MSVKQMGLAFELDLPAPTKWTLVALADHADHDGHNARPGIKLLAWKTGQSTRTVQRHLRELEKAGLIVAVGYRGGGYGRATCYRLDLDKGDNLTPLDEAE